jgi:glucose-fructose oxidoreductase
MDHGPAVPPLCRTFSRDDSRMNFISPQAGGDVHTSPRAGLQRAESQRAESQRAKTAGKARSKIRYAVVGLGHIAQTAVLPAFENARKNSVLAALVSEDETKLRELSERHQVPHRYKELDECLQSGEVDAIYIAVPNHLHCDHTVRAAQAGVHVLCEKPMAVTIAECERMIEATEAAAVKLMIAYRLHFETANVKAAELARSGALGDLRLFSSLFCLDVQDGNVRLEREKGGGTLYDIGVYCINAARYLFEAEPTEVCAFSANNGEPRFADIDEMTGALLRFPEQRLATFITSFGAPEVGMFQLVGTKGTLRVDPAYDYAAGLTHHLTIDGKTTKRTYRKRDQFAPELTYFSDCILHDRHPEPDGREGLIDVAIVEALYSSAVLGRPLRLTLPPKKERPSMSQVQFRPPVKEPAPVHAAAPQA